MRLTTETVLLLRITSMGRHVYSAALRSTKPAMTTDMDPLMTYERSPSGSFMSPSTKPT